MARRSRCFPTGMAGQAGEKAVVSVPQLTASIDTWLGFFKMTWSPDPARFISTEKISREWEAMVVKGIVLAIPDLSVRVQPVRVMAEVVGL